MKIYIVREYGGQWEDSWEQPVCAFEDRTDAEKLRDQIIKAHEEQDKQKAKCQECKYMYDDGDKPKCFKPMAYDPEECETLDIIYDDWCGVDIRELEYVPKRAMWICPNCGLEVHKDFKKCVRCGAEMVSEDNQDIVVADEAYAEYKANPKTYTLGEIIEMNDLSIEATPKRGRWIEKKDFIYCSECDDGFDAIYKIDYRYCSNCGARME